MNKDTWNVEYSRSYEGTFENKYSQASLFETGSLLPVWEGLPNDWTPQSALAELDSLLSQAEISHAAGKPLATQEVLAIYGLMLVSLVVKKNQRYGNSATSPMEIFARGVSTRERLRVRMDDKLNRIIRGTNFTDNEDPRVDLAGYLLLDLCLDALEKMVWDFD